MMQDMQRYQQKDTKNTKKKKKTSPISPNGATLFINWRKEICERLKRSGMWKKVLAMTQNYRQQK